MESPVSTYDLNLSFAQLPVNLILFQGTKPRQSSVKAQQEIQREIHSESQRMVRESRISLPYHRPKQRTLAEFLARYNMRRFDTAEDTSFMCSICKIKL